MGTTLRRKWTLEAVLGEGGLGTVYRARHAIGHEAAIRLLHRGLARAEPKLRRYLEREAEAVVALGHPGLVRIFDVDETEDGVPFVVMELLEGETLAAMVERKGPIHPRTLLHVLDETLDVLVAGHEQRLVHGDITPMNLVLARESVKVLEWGSAAVRAQLARTLPGEISLGTLGFMPPEQVRGEPSEPRVDLFALGATAYFAATGALPFLVEEGEKLAEVVVERGARPVSLTPEHLGWLVERALAYLPTRRYPDAKTMRGDVWAVVRNERPPYAYACREARLAPSATSDEAGSTVTFSPLVEEDTDRQLPAFVAHTRTKTEPQAPVFAQAEDDSDA